MRTYSNEIIGFINLFENATRALVKDCFLEDSGTLVFVVQPGMLGKALGKQAANVKRISALVKKPVRVLEYDPDPVKFLTNVLYPIRPKEIVREDAVVIIRANDLQEKGKIFGRERSNFKRLQGILSKYFSLELRIE
ncbi:NusA-like transcription termination signal-binding factor [Candidatus Woesearchaeota archaeon]|nr:NusA-like transcription termination signal-binding factor [Candidatus Woesearchaeota archaeon]